jgi:ribosomal protein L37AE/L43A
MKSCSKCGEPVSSRRYDLGYRVCLPCGEEQARAVKHTVAPLHKSNYMLFTNRQDLVGINNKGGLVK